MRFAGLAVQRSTRSDSPGEDAADEGGGRYYRANRKRWPEKEKSGIFEPVAYLRKRSWKEHGKRC